jgi:hypothetical protein
VQFAVQLSLVVQVKVDSACKYNLVFENHISSRSIVKQLK